MDREIRTCSGRPVEGSILAVHPGCDLVALDLGAGSGIETGSRPATYREGRRLHDVVVSDLFEDLAAARIDRLRHSKLPELREGDVVVFAPDDR